jgi:hypothetical protein
MRNALNSMQSTVSGFGLVSAENVFKVRARCVFALVFCHHHNCVYAYLALHRCQYTLTSCFSLPQRTTDLRPAAAAQDPRRPGEVLAAAKLPV